MSNQEVDEDVRWALSGAVFEAVHGAAYRVMYRFVNLAVLHALDQTVYQTVYWAGKKDSGHPALQDFLREARL